MRLNLHIREHQTVVKRVEEHLTVTRMSVSTPFLHDEIAVGIEEVGVGPLADALEEEIHLPIIVDDEVLTHLRTVVQVDMDVQRREFALVIVCHILLRLGIRLTDVLDSLCLILCEGRRAHHEQGEKSQYRLLHRVQSLFCVVIQLALLHHRHDAMVLLAAGEQHVVATRQATVLGEQESTVQ